MGHWFLPLRTLLGAGSKPLLRERGELPVPYMLRAYGSTYPREIKRLVVKVVEFDLPVFILSTASETISFLLFRPSLGRRNSIQDGFGRAPCRPLPEALAAG